MPSVTALVEASSKAAACSLILAVASAWATCSLRSKAVSSSIIALSCASLSLPNSRLQFNDHPELIASFKILTINLALASLSPFMIVGKSLPLRSIIMTLSLFSLTKKTSW